MSISIATVGDTAAAKTEALEALRGEVTVFRRCDELTEAIALAEVGRVDILLLSEPGDGLDATLLERLAESHVRVVLLDDGASSETARALNIATISDATDADTLARIISAVHHGEGNEREGRHGAESYARVRPGELPPDEFALNSSPFNPVNSVNNDGGASPEPVGSPLRFPHQGEEGGDPGSEGNWGNRGSLPSKSSNVGKQAHGEGGEVKPEGKIIVVWGPLGAPGTSTVAVNLAAELALDGEDVILIDANTYGASIAGMLGLLDESAGLAGACRQADQGLLTEESLRSLVLNISVLGARLQVLTGLTLSSRWIEVRATALENVVRCAARCASAVVIDTPFSLETSDELSWDAPVPRRNAAALRPIELASEIVAVGSADSIGVPRLINALGDLNELGFTAALKVVLNKVRPGAVGSHPQRQLAAAWERYAPVANITGFLPYDQDSLDKAVLAGKTLAEMAPESELRRGIQGLFMAAGSREQPRALRGRKAKVKFSRNGDRLEGDGAQRGASSKHI